MCSEQRCSCFSKTSLRVTIASRVRRAAMRWCVSIGAVLVSGAVAGGDVAGIAAPDPRHRGGPLAHKDPAPAVAVELVLAPGVSSSLGMGELGGLRGR